jgi:hypothetical protein
VSLPQEQNDTETAARTRKACRENRQNLVPRSKNRRQKTGKVRRDRTNSKKTSVRVYKSKNRGRVYKKTTNTTAGRVKRLTSIIGNIAVSEKQATRLKLDSNQRRSNYLEECCLRASANVSYENAARDIEKYTGIKVSAKTQQRIVYRHKFPEAECEDELEEIGVDGGKVRLRTEEKGKECSWKDYKAICANKSVKQAWLGENELLVEWVNHQKMGDSVTCLGDGHPGVWKLVAQFNCPVEVREILDWFHLVENLHKVGGSFKRLKTAENLLWKGKVDETIELISVLTKKPAQNFCKYLENHRHRIVNYDYYQSEGICSIGSGAVESTIKQIDRRLKISGAQWKESNVSQVLKHRCAYLNHQL